MKQSVTAGATRANNSKGEWMTFNRSRALCALAAFT